MNSDQIIKKICHVVVIILAVKFLFSMGTFDSVTYKGTGYTINFPTGWKTTKEELVDIGIYFTSVEDKDVVTFYPEGALNPESGQPETHMTIVSGKLASPAWIQDLWPDIVKAIIDSKAKSIIGGGDTIVAVSNWGMLDKFSFVSTGGGAMLDFLAKETLPGIIALESCPILQNKV